MNFTKFRVSAGRMIATAALAVTVLAVVPAQPAAAVTAGTTLGPYNFVFGNSGKCFDDPDFANTPDTLLDQWTCGSGSNLKWYLDYVTSTTFRIRGASSGLCVNVSKGTYVNDTPIILYGCSNVKNETFQFSSTPYGKAPNVDDWIEAVGNPNMVLNVTRSSSSNGAGILLYTRSTSTNEYVRVVSGQPTTPARSNTVNKPVYFIHGYDVDDPASKPLSMSSYWGQGDYAFITEFNSSDGAGERPVDDTVVWCYYSGNTGCDRNVGGDRNAAIEDIGISLAWDIFNNYSRYGKPVDVVAHSMGGLVIKAAIQGVALHDPQFPPYLYVENTVTIESPLDGITVYDGWGCDIALTAQCTDMEEGSSFLSWLTQDAPNSTMGTDWTLIGANDDYLIRPASSVPLGLTAEHKIIYASGQFGAILNVHMNTLSYVTGEFNYSYCNLDVGTDYCTSSSDFTEIDDAFGSPALNASWASYYESLE